MSMYEENNMDEHELVDAFSRQTISFNGISDFASHEVHGKEVSVEVGEGTHGGGSSKLFTKVVVNFSWDNKYYIGSQLAVDYTGTFMAYALVLDGDCPGAVRVVSLKDDKRGLVRAMRGPVKDLDFSYHTSCLLLAAVDAYGHLYVYNVGRSQDRLDLTPLLTITRDHIFEASEYHRVVWCTYLTETLKPTVGPDGERMLSSEPVLQADPSTFLILTDEKGVEIWDTRAVTTKFGSGPFNYLDLMKQMNVARNSVVDRYVGYAYLMGHEKPVVQAVFSPDGGAVATASQDGQVRFFQVDLESEPQLLHSFMAHEGRPLSCLYFLDNIRDVSDEMKFWKYAITGADYNREIKLWCCGTFSCLQTITFRPPPSLDSWFKVEVDATGRYILMSDIHRRMLYVLLFHEAEEEASSSSHIASISEFPLALPFLSLKIRDAGKRRVKQGASDEDVLLNGECGEVNGEHKKKVFVKMFAVQPKGIQECTVLFDPHSSVPDGNSTASFPTFSLDESVVQDNLAELSAACLGGIIDYEDETLDVMPNGIAVQESVPVKTELVEIKQEPEEEEEEQLGAVGGAPSSTEVSPPLINFDAGAQTQGLNNESFITPPQPKEINKIKNLVELPDQRPPIQSSSSSSSSSEAEEERPGSEAWDRSGTQGLDETLKSLKDILKELKDEKKAERNRKEALRQEVSELRAEMVNLRTIVNSRAVGTTDVRVTDALSSLDSASRSTAQKIDEIQKSLSKGLNKKDVDSISSSVAKAVDSTQIRNTITQTCNELRQSVRNDVKKELQGVHSQLKKVADVAGQPGQISEAQARAIGNCLTSPVAKYLEQAVVGIFAPVLDRMAKAVDKSFKDLGNAVGHEVVDQVRKVTTTVQCESENLVRQLNANQASVDTEKLIAAIVQANNQAILRTSTELKAELLQTVRREIAQAVKDQSATMTAAVLRSAASTPAPTAQARVTQDALLDLVQNGNINEAFKRALGAADATLVDYLLRKLNVANLVAKRGLEPGIFLALMQQLSVTISTKTDIKVDILQAGISILDVKDPTVKEHLPPVAASIKSHLTSYVQAHPDSRHCGTIRLLVLAVDALLMHLG